MSNARLSDQDILERFRGVVAASLSIDPASITEDAYLDDLGAESLDLLEISIETENAFHILLPETNIFEAAATVFGPGVLYKDGILTDEGVRLLRQRMPEVRVPEDGGVRLADVRRASMRVGAWVRLIRFLVEQRPQVCPACAVDLVGGTPGRVKCQKCGTEYDIPLGDAVNRAWVDEYRRTHHTPSTDAAPGATRPAEA